MNKVYVGLSSTFHDNAMAIVDSHGKVLFAEATERYLQTKRSLGCAPDFIGRTLELLNTYCPPDSQIVVAHSWSTRALDGINPGLEAIKEREKQLVELFGEVPEFLGYYLGASEYISMSQAHTVPYAGKTLKYELNQREGRRYLCELEERRYEHHLSHAAVGCYSAPFSEAACAVIDGFGEDSSTACFRFSDSKIAKVKEIPTQSTGSLGFIYNLICATCGFGMMTGEEWKVMGLASYGALDKDLYKTLKQMVEVDGVTIKAAPESVMFFLLKKLYKSRRKKGEDPLTCANVAYTGQQVFSEIYFNFLKNLRSLGISDNLVLGGGCALNSAANGKIVEKTGFKKVHIFSAPGDDGNALGAAYLAYQEDHSSEQAASALWSPYLGSAMSNTTLDNVSHFGPANQSEMSPDALCRRAADALAQGKIVGWVQGRAEYGPRALGNRSILADARDPDMKDKINSRVKFREEFRPFAPSILHEYGPEYFLDYQESPYMERALTFREDVKLKVPAVVHIDGTGRLQTVKQEWNERFYQLIDAFRRQTGIPLILNTSFNVMGKPIIHTVEDALAVFYTSGLDVLVIGNLYIEKEAPRATADHSSMAIEDYNQELLKK
jgi:carbamoyltransferase